MVASTLSKSITPRFPTPAAVKYCNTGQPKPPAPITKRARDENGNCLPVGEHLLDQLKNNDKTRKNVPNVGNNHPTVKPVELMKYLVKLVTPAGGKVLDPFNGSGSTGMACVELDYEYTGCELDPEYIEIATKRIESWYEHTRPEDNFDELFEK